MERSVGRPKVTGGGAKIGEAKIGEATTGEATTADTSALKGAAQAGERAAKTQGNAVMAKGKDVQGPKAVAISYARGQDRAPRVVAKGRGDLARHILDLAEAHGLPVRKDGDLVEVLEAVEVDEAIPLEAYALIAEILAYVYMANNGAPSDNWTPANNWTPAPWTPAAR